jgi:hypothetical protein
MEYFGYIFGSSVSYLIQIQNLEHPYITPSIMFTCVSVAQIILRICIAFKPVIRPDTLVFKVAVDRQSAIMGQDDRGSVALVAFILASQLISCEAVLVLTQVLQVQISSQAYYEKLFPMLSMVSFFGTVGAVNVFIYKRMWSVDFNTIALLKSSSSAVVAALLVFLSFHKYGPDKLPFFVSIGILYSLAYPILICSILISMYRLRATCAEFFPSYIHMGKSLSTIETYCTMYIVCH